MDVMRSLSAISKVFQRADLSLQVVTEQSIVHLRTLRKLLSEPEVSGIMVNEFRGNIEDGEDETITYREVEMLKLLWLKREIPSPSP